PLMCRAVRSLRPAAFQKPDFLLPLSRRATGRHIFIKESVFAFVQVENVEVFKTTRTNEEHSLLVHRPAFYDAPLFKGVGYRIVYCCLGIPQPSA
ncbi:MAG: hypothetical protein K2H25_04910, partial [Alistipes sp.]|nr:hypothetical protein [Alistipes sp.]